MMKKYFNNKNYLKISACLSSVFLLFIPFFFALAKITNDGSQTPKYTIQNPLIGNGTVDSILLSIMGLVTTVGSIVVVFFIIYSGYKFVTAGSSDTDRTDAKKIFFATIVGGAILLGANIIAYAVVNTVKCTIGAPGCSL